MGIKLDIKPPIPSHLLNDAVDKHPITAPNMRYIRSLRLTDFRSYTALDVEFSGKPVVLYGPNGAGKTNLMEAVSFLSPGRGLRRAKMDDIAHRAGDITAAAWGVKAELDGTDNPVTLLIGQVPENPRRRIVRIDDKNASSTELASHMTMMWLTPAQDRIFTGPASERRKFLDRFTLVHTPSHGLSSLRYEKLRSERNRLLSEGISDPAWYEALETDMASHGAKIALARAETINHLIGELADQRVSTFPSASLILEGEAEEHAQNGWGEDEISDFIRQQLEKERPRDRAAGRTLNGVHRSDFIVNHQEKSLPASDCSTGEQKALLISLTLAHARAQIDKAPILLLDEVAAHLDQDRRADLAQHLLDLGTQIFMTGTDQNLFEAFGSMADVFAVQNGNVETMI